MDVPAARRLRGVDVCVGIYPDDGDLAAQSLAESLCGTGDGPDSNGMVTPDRERKLTSPSNVVDLLAEGARHAAARLRLLHAAVVRILSRRQVGVRVYRPIIRHVQLEILFQRRYQSGVNERLWATIDAVFGLNFVLLVSHVHATLWKGGSFPILCSLASQGRPTWPPLKATATRPMSVLFFKNLDFTYGADDMLGWLE